MSKLEVLDPPMCCATGVCGPNVDPALKRFAADVEWLEPKGAKVERFNLAQQREAFDTRDAVKEALAESGESSLPLILVDGRIVTSGAYPTREELAGFVEIEMHDQTREQPSAHGEHAGAAPELSETVAEHREAIYRYILSIVRDTTEAEDLTQDALLRAHRKRATLEDPRRLVPWVYRIATNICRDRFRQASIRRRPQSLDAPSEEDVGATREESLADDQIAALAAEVAEKVIAQM